MKVLITGNSNDISKDIIDIEIKKLESRVGLTPSAVKEYCNHGHKVYIENNAGLNSGFTNED